MADTTPRSSLHHGPLLSHLQTKESFSAWQKRISTMVDALIALQDGISDRDARFFAEHADMLCVPGLSAPTSSATDSHVPDYGAIADGSREPLDDAGSFTYHLPYLAAYTLRHGGDASMDIVLSMLALYDQLTGTRFLDTDWQGFHEMDPSLQKKAIDNFRRYVEEKKLADMPVYLLGQKYYNKLIEKGRIDMLSKTISIRHLDQYHVSEWIQKSSLFRGKIEKLFFLAEEAKRLEGLRGMIVQSYSTLARSPSVSDRAWLVFLRDQAQKSIRNIEEHPDSDDLQWEKWHTMDEDARAEWRAKETEKHMDIARHAESRLSELGTDADATTPLEDLIDAKGFRKLREECVRNRDFARLDAAETAMFHTILGVLSRFHKNTSDSYTRDGIPRYFLGDGGTLTCFSGVWMIVSLLVACGFSREDIYVCDLQQTSKEWIVKHAYVIVRKHDTKFSRIDYGFGRVSGFSAVESVDIGMFLSGLDRGIRQKTFFYTRNKGILDKKWILYRADDGILLLYLMSVAGEYIESGRYDDALDLLRTAKGLDPDSPHIDELFGVAYDMLGDTDRSMKHFRTALKNSHRTSLHALFRVGQDTFQKGDYDEARKYLETLRKHISKEWNIQSSWRHSQEHKRLTIEYLERIYAETNVSSKSPEADIDRVSWSRALRSTIAEGERLFKQWNSDSVIEVTRRFWKITSSEERLIVLRWIAQHAKDPEKVPATLYLLGYISIEKNFKQDTLSMDIDITSVSSIDTTAKEIEEEVDGEEAEDEMDEE